MAKLTSPLSVSFLVSVAQSDLKHYPGPVAVDLLGPGGAAMGHWTYRGVQGARRLSYTLAERTAVGQWSIRVQAGDASQTRQFHVLAWQPGRVDVVVDMARQFVLGRGDHQLTATITANCSETGLPVEGSLGLTAVLLDTATREELGKVVLSQPEWADINSQGSFLYTKEQVQDAR